MNTYFRQAVVLCSCAFTLHAVAAQEQTSEKPIVIEAKIGVPKVKVLEAEQEANRRYEKWEEKKLVLLGLVMPSDENRTFVSQEIKYPLLDLQIQANEKKADFSKKWDQLKAELGDVKSATPKLKTWNLSRPVSTGEATIPIQTFRESSTTGHVCYIWVTRTMEMEGVHIGKKTMFKATIKSSTSGPYMFPLEGGSTFDAETAKIVRPENKK